MTEKDCCAPRANRSLHGNRSAPNSIAKQTKFEPALCAIPGGPAFIGTDSPIIALDDEAPLRRRKIKAFNMMETPVTNDMFAQFVAATGYETEADLFGWSFVFHHNVAEGIEATQAVAGTQWWRRVDGANWHLINGPGSEDAYHPDHPVVHVTWSDARAFAKWAGGRLPTEPEWEHAARGGLGDVRFPWGQTEPNETDHFPCNIWQGSFPNTNTAADGYIATAPAKSYAPNGYGLYNMCGNVWEWTADPLKLRSLSKRKRAAANKPAGSKILKGGSFLCHDSYCYRYRIAARTGTTPDTSTAHQGFRLVF